MTTQKSKYREKEMRVFLTTQENAKTFSLHYVCEDTDEEVESYEIDDEHLAITLRALFADNARRVAIGGKIADRSIGVEMLAYLDLGSIKKNRHTGHTVVLPAQRA